MAEPLLSYLHYLSIILTGGFLIGELVMCRPEITPEQRRRLPGIDVVFFVAALLALATGLLRLFFYAKGVSFYVGNPFFWVKMALYVIIAAMSIAPTRAFGRWKRALDAGGAPPTAPEIAGVRRLLHIELGLLALLPLMAVLMARGIGR
jgi:putative membrane protein